MLINKIIKSNNSKYIINLSNKIIFLDRFKNLKTLFNYFKYSLNNITKTETIKIK